MLCQMDTEHQSCILDDNRAVHPNIQLSMSKLDDFVLHDNHYTSHTVTDDTMDYPLAMANMLLESKITNTTTKNQLIKMSIAYTAQDMYFYKQQQQRTPYNYLERDDNRLKHFQCNQEYRSTLVND